MNKYIKIDKNTTEKMAVEHLKSLGGKVYDNLMKENGNGIIKLDIASDILYTSYNEQELIGDGYEEIKLEDLLDNSFKLGEQIAVSDDNKEDTIEYLDGDDCKYYYTGGKMKNGNHIVEDNYGNTNQRKYIAKLPKEETIEIGGQTYNKKAFEKAVKNLEPINN